MVGDLDWYLRESSRRRTPSPRCPFASADHCPRYYQSLSLLAGAGFTGISPTEEKRLLRKWKRSELWPKTDEQASSVSGSGEKPYMFSNFCPEVSFDGFGWFATLLARYADGLDLETAHAQLAAQRADSSDWRWQWSAMSPMHYSGCPVYSVLTNQKTAPSPTLRDYFIALTCNMLANVFLWFVPNNLSLVNKGLFLASGIFLSAYVLCFRSLDAAGKLRFWLAARGRSSDFQAAAPVQIH